MSADCCLACGCCLDSIHREVHHSTGRDSAGDYLDPRLTALLCAGCHHRLHNRLRRLGLDHPDGGGVIGETAIRLHRVGVVILVVAGRPGLPAELARFLEALGAALASWARDLDALSGVGRSA